MKKLLLLFLLVTAPAFASAQLTSEDLSISISPELPEPGDEVKLSVESFVFDLNRSQITWRIDGQQVAQAVGSQDITFRAGAVGRTHTVTVSVISPSSGTVTKTITVRPAQLELLWQAQDSYTPQFYKGKALNAHDSGVLVQAYPYFLDSFGNQINPKSLIYTWKVNNKPQPSASGFGRDTFSFPGPSLYRDAFITVDVESPDNTYRARRSMNLEAQQPRLLFYAENSLFGGRLINPVAGGSLILDQEEVVVRAEPYYFSDLNNRVDVEYDWNIDGRDILVVGDRNELALRRPEQGSGQSQISLEIKHVGKLLQYARTSFTALFQDGE